MHVAIYINGKRGRLFKIFSISPSSYSTKKKIRFLLAEPSAKRPEMDYIPTQGSYLGSFCDMIHPRGLRRVPGISWSSFSQPLKFQLPSKVGRRVYLPAHK